MCSSQSNCVLEQKPGGGIMPLEAGRVLTAVNTKLGGVAKDLN